MKKLYTFAVLLFVSFSNAQNTVNSTLSFAAVASIPVNDESNNAILITNGNNITEFPQNVSTIGATNSIVSTSPCENGMHKDVWYKVIIPASGNLTIETSSSSISNPFNDTVFSVFTGSPSFLNYLNCNDDGPIPNFSKLSLTGRTAGEIIYIVVWGFGGTEDVFKISAYDVSIPLSTQNFAANSVYLSPNPTKDFFTLSELQPNSNLIIYNLLGQEVLVKSLLNTSEIIDVSALKSSTYLVKITSETNTFQTKIIKE